MSDSNETGKKRMSKGLIATIVTIAVLIGGAAAAMFMISSSPKESYFKAEVDTVKFLAEELKERYEPELNWNEKTMEEPTESTMELSANYNGPSEVGLGMDPAQIINNSKLTILTQSDMPNKELSASLSANIAGMNIENFDFFVTAEEILVELPFLDELLQIKDEDFGALLHELDPYTFTGEERLNLETIFENPYGNLSEDHMEHFKKEYFEMIYEELPEDAFTSTKETVEVYGESINAEKIEMILSEDEVKEIIIIVLEKMKSDETLKDIIKDEMTVQSLGAGIVESDVDEMLREFDENIDEAKEDIADFHIPDGLHSTIWINDGLIVQRDFSIEMGPDAEDLVLFSVTGNQLFTTTSQTVDYEFAYSDNYGEGSLLLDGGFNWEDNEGKDKITITADDVNLIYEASETLEDNSREFDRIFSFEDSFDQASFNWSGVANYDNDKMSSEHEITFDMPEVSSDMFALHMNIKGQVINGVDLPDGDNVKNLGTMSQNELMNYFEMDVYPAFEEWLYGNLMGGGMGF